MTARRAAADEDRLPPSAEAVLELVETIPAGRVLTYADVAELVGSGPRVVGNVLARYGSQVPWWRVLRAGGLPPVRHEQEALRRYREEGTPLDPRGDRVDMALARWEGAVATV